MTRGATTGLRRRKTNRGVWRGALLALALSISPHAPAARADMGAIRARSVVGTLDVTLATSPTPLRAGTIEVNALVLDAVTGAVRSPVDLTFELIPPVAEPAAPENATEQAPSMGADPMGARPTGSVVVVLERVRDRVDPLVTARLEVPSVGLWTLHAGVRSGAESARLTVALPIEGGNARWSDVWDLLALPVVVVLVFTCHQGLRRRARPRGAQAEPLRIGRAPRT